MRYIYFFFILLSLSIPSFADNQTILTLRSATLQVEQAEGDFRKANFNALYAQVIALRPLLLEATELHSQLYNALKDDTNATITAEQERMHTISFAKLRDRINYLAGMISLQQNNHREAVKHFVEVIQSQRTTGLGKKAYTELRNLGFSPKLDIREQF